MFYHCLWHLQLKLTRILVECSCYLILVIFGQKLRGYDNHTEEIDVDKNTRVLFKNNSQVSQCDVCNMRSSQLYLRNNARIVYRSTV